ncbi:M23 family metallopeptidase [Flavicella marina]|uniref:M23 family metallopeptidase n=1 Tax=Flavicella marina TaxID=1475951 RepID=UPI00186B1D70|nr:M23 family metallopeptidase [Flavicella marina]
MPTTKTFAFYHKSKIEYFTDSTVIYLNNPVNCPLRYFLKSNNQSIKKLLNQYDTITLKPLSDSIIVIRHKNFILKEKIILKNKYGNPRIPINKYPISLPFKTNTKYKVIQGYNGIYSHNHIGSLYAIDFNLRIGDTICASDNGYVVGVIDCYSENGDREWTDYANYITIYHPKSNLFTQYVHLDKNGSLVKQGDTIKTGQPIAISGYTGFTNHPHLHFNVKCATDSNWISQKVNFIEGYKGIDLKKNTIVKK